MEPTCHSWSALELEYKMAGARIRVLLDDLHASTDSHRLGFHLTPTHSAR